MRDKKGQFTETHGMSRTREYSTWANILDRCNNPKCHNYPKYGGRGIIVCERWMSFPNFFIDMGLKPKGTSIERIDNNGPYIADNCRWATPKEQSKNRRTNRYFSFRGKRKLLCEWAHILDLPLNTLKNRIRRGWSIKTAFTTPRRVYPEVA